MRQIVVQDQVWGYFIGKHNVVLTLPNDGPKRVITLDKITGRSLEAIDRGRKNKTEDGMVRPSDLRAFILKEFPVEEENK